MALYHLPEGNKVKRWGSGVVVSFRMLLALWRQCYLKMSSIEGRGYALIVFMTLWRAVLSAAEQLAYHTVMKHAFYGAAVERHEQLLGQVGCWLSM